MQGRAGSMVERDYFLGEDMGRCGSILCGCMDQIATHSPICVDSCALYLEAVISNLRTL